MKNKDGINYILVNSTFFVFIFYLLHKINLLNEIVNLFVLLFLSLMLSYIIYPIYKLFTKKINNIVAIIIIYMLLLFILLSFVYIVILNSNLLNKLIDLFSNILKFVDQVNLKYNLNIDLEIYLEKVINYFINNVVFLLKDVLNYLTEFIFVIVLSICILLNIQYVKMLINKIKYKQLLYNINEKLKMYLIANIKIIVVQFIEYTVSFFIIGHPNYLLLGILNSINSFIPYIGTLLTNVIAITTASVISNRLLLLTSIISVILPNLDSYLITPKIYKHTNKLPQTLCISFVIIFGFIFGVIGILFAIPSLIIIIEVLKYKNIVKLE